MIELAVIAFIITIGVVIALTTDYDERFIEWVKQAIPNTSQRFQRYLADRKKLAQEKKQAAEKRREEKTKADWERIANMVKKRTSIPSTEYLNNPIRARNRAQTREIVNNYIQRTKESKAQQTKGVKTKSLAVEEDRFWENRFDKLEKNWEQMEKNFDRQMKELDKQFNKIDDMFK